MEASLRAARLAPVAGIPSELEAAAKLAAALRPLGVEPALETQAIEEDAWKANPPGSNRWIAGKPIEEWLSANVGMSRCCSVCGDSDCRTLEVGGRTYEPIPEELFIKAGLTAASIAWRSHSCVSPQSASCSENLQINLMFPDRLLDNNAMR